MKITMYFFAFLFITSMISCSQEDQLDISDQVESEKRQAIIGNWIARPCVDITIFIDPGCVDNWKNSLGPSIDAFNAVPDAAINMVEVTSLPADIVINCVDFNGSWSSTIGLGEWPDVDGEVGGQIFMNTDYDSSCGVACWSQGIMMHELAHNLGFVHGSQENLPALSVGSWTYDPVTGTFTNDTPGVQFPGEHIDGTPFGNGDKESIFNNGVTDCASPICHFTNYDIIAMQKLYPMDDPCDCLPAIDGPCDCPEEFPDLVETKCTCICEYFNSVENEWIEYFRTEVDCLENVSCSRFTSKGFRSWIEEDCTVI